MFLMKPFVVVAPFLVLFSLCSCDLGVEADVTEDDEVSSRELSPEKRRNREGVNLFAAPKSLPSKTAMKQSRELAMKNLGLQVLQGGEAVAGGAADIIYTENRDTTVISRSIRKFVVGDASMTMKMKMRGQPANEQVEPYPLSGQTIVADGEEISMENVPDAEQKEALKSFQVDWVGGNALFEDATFKRGAPWIIPAEKVLGAIFAETFTEGTGDAKLTIQKFFTFEGVETAEVTVSLNRCRGIMMDPAGENVEIELQGYGTLYRSLDTPHTTRVEIDGTTAMTMKQGEVDLKFNGPFDFLAKSAITLPE